MNKLTLLLCSLAFTGCAVSYNPIYYYNELQVYNRSGGTITDVSLRVLGSQRSVSCDEVNYNALCHDRFGRKRYPQQGLELGWTDSDGSRKSETVNSEVQAYFVTGAALRIVLEIKQDGSVEIIYEQDEPGRDGGVFIN